MAKEKPRGFRFTRELLDALEAAAEADHRSVNNYVETVLMFDLRAKGYLPPARERIETDRPKPRRRVRGEA